MLQALICVLNVYIIGITESWLTPDIGDAEVQLAGYEMFRRDRDNARGGGVLLYGRHSLLPSEFHTSASFCDQVWCKLGNLCNGLCYRSSNVNIVGEDNNEHLLDLITEVGNKHVLLMGDFNFPSIDWNNFMAMPTEDSFTKAFLKVVEDSFLSQHVTVPTRGNSVFDLVFSTEPDLVSDVKIIENLDKIDHSMLTFYLHLDYTVDHSRTVRRDYNKGDYDSIRKALSVIDWSALNNSTSTVEEYRNSFKAILAQLEEKFIPTKTYHSDRLKKPVWMTHKSWKSVKRKYKVFSKYKNKDLPAVIAANRTAKKDLRKARMNFEKKLAHNIKQDSKSFYSYVRSKSKAKVRICSLKQDSGTVLDDDFEIATCFNTFSHQCSHRRIFTMCLSQ